jgi:hypothetical protein
MKELFSAISWCTISVVTTWAGGGPSAAQAREVLLISKNKASRVFMLFMGGLVIGVSG